MAATMKLLNILYSYHLIIFIQRLISSFRAPGLLKSGPAARRRRVSLDRPRRWIGAPRGRVVGQGFAQGTADLVAEGRLPGRGITRFELHSRLASISSVFAAPGGANYCIEGRRNSPRQAIVTGAKAALSGVPGANNQMSSTSSDDASAPASAIRLLDTVP